MITTIVQWSKLPEFCYGPIAFIHEEGTRIHWCTYKQTKTHLSGQKPESNSRSNYHSVFVNSTQFSYQIPGIKAQYSYNLPQTISKFFVMSDTHNNTKYTSPLNNIDFDFLQHNGDLCKRGHLNELQTGFKNLPTKPMLFATGNHDYGYQQGQFVKHVTQRPMNYFQKINNLFFFSVYIQHGLENDAFEFLSQNAFKAVSAEHVFISVHFPPYATGKYGANKTLSLKMENFIDSHPQLKIRAVFSGHNHNFAAFRRNNLMYFINGVGGGSLHPVYDQSEMGGRVWKTESLHGPQEVIVGDDASYGYQYHLDSWLKYTRTEVEFQSEKQYIQSVIWMQIQF
ncbi:Alkaline_phosphatase [Hexamita inflata]|uniref:Alkaline phosphatase n=1 Tax=Hexamita inflata TaxID=28002 RepID=A0AA86QAV1_9EUKA|nr:Alkaline phosphatase [Hexamita inflata]